ncbi:MAG: tetratricopeptide repeat protein [Chitinispirillaceae bacterium]|nr:tetratricopeptide repeat protein [Chitinispirillaceae bacterium]
MKTIITSLCMLSLIAFPPSLAAGSKKQPDGFSLIKGIQSPQELLFPFFPKKYCVPVTLTGSIADEMKNALDSLKIEMPVYNESFNGVAFDLVLANESYSSQTRELLSGILNPVELIDIVVSSVVKYRQPNEFSKIMGETKVFHDTCTYANEPAYKVSLAPTGERFAYSYQDMGTFVHESWLTMLTLTISASSRLVYELSTVRYSRTFGTGSEKPKADMMNARYLFVYEEKDGVPLPHRLTVYFNNVEVLKLQATYRKKDKLFLFDNKELCTSIEGKPACLNVHYGDYRFALCKYAQEAPKAKGKKYSNRIEKAAELSKKANDMMRKGNISKAIRALQNLVEKYGDTPQAVEAKRLLSQLPRELQ